MLPCGGFLGLWGVLGRGTGSLACFGFAVILGIAVYGASGASLPGTPESHWIPDDFKIIRDGSGNVIDDEIPTWTSEEGYDAEQTGSSSLVPTVVEGASHCFGAASFQDGKFLEFGNPNKWDLTTDGKSVFVTHRLRNLGSSDAVLQKGSGTSYWAIKQSVAGSIAMVEARKDDGNGDLGGSRFRTFTDTSGFHTIGAVFSAANPSVITAYLDGKSANWTTGDFGLDDDEFEAPLEPTENMILGGKSSVTPIRGADMEVLDILIYDSALTESEVEQVTDYLNERYHMTCPTLTGTNVDNGVDVGDTCSGAHWGDRCTQQCKSGFQRVAGTEAHQCIMGQWTGSELRCEKLCSDLTAPRYYASCERQVVSESFDSETNFNKYWSVSPKVPAAAEAKYWKIDAGELVSNAGESCDGSSSYVPSIAHLAEPIWKTQVSASMEVRTRSFFSIDTVNVPDQTIEDDINESPSFGVVMRYTDSNNYYRVMLNPDDNFEQFQVLEKVVGGVVTEIGRKSMHIEYGDTYILRTTTKDNSIKVTIEKQSGGSGEETLFDITDDAHSYGSVGFISAGAGAVQTFDVYTDCDGGSSCQAAPAGTKCTFTCEDGFEAVGDPESTCTAGASPTDKPTWDNTNYTCAVAKPTIITESVSVMEDSPVETPVGDPIEVSSTSENIAIIFDIESSPQDGNGNDIFEIGACSGQITVASAVLDYETASSYVVTVSATPSGAPGSKATKDITVNIENGNDAPEFIRYGTSNPGCPVTCYVYESWTVNHRMVCTDRYNDIWVRDEDGASITYTFDYDDTNGAFRITNYGSRIRLHIDQTRPFDYETRTSYKLGVRATDSVDTSLSNVCDITLNIYNANEAPNVVSPQQFDVQEDDATAGAAIPTPFAAVDPDAGNTVYYTIVGGESAGNFTINTNTGVFSWVADHSSWLPNDPSYGIDGRTVREDFTVLVEARDQSNLRTTGTARIYLIADTTAIPTPVLDAIQGSTTGFLTAGGQSVSFTGSNLDSPDQFRASLTSEDGLRTYDAGACTKDSATQITCTTPAGVGANLAWKVEYFDGVWNEASQSKELRISYRSPLIDSNPFQNAAGDGQYWNMPTGGGIQLTISGAGFGTDESLIKLYYGPYNDYWMEATVLSATNQRIVFRTTEGFGRYLRLYVDVAGQTYTRYVYQSGRYFQHAAPTFTRAYLSSYYTSRGYSLTNLPMLTYTLLYIDGNNLGPRYKGTVLQRPGFTFGPKDPLGRTYLDYEQFGALFCYNQWSTPHTRMYCYLHPGVGKDLQFKVTVGGYESAGSGDCCGIYLGYAPPQIVSVAGLGTRNADTQGGQPVTLTGYNLGPVGSGSIDWVRYGKGLAASGGVDNGNPIYTAQDCSVVTFVSGGLSTLECKTAEGVGVNLDWRLSIGGQEADYSKSTALIRASSYGPPIVSSFSGVGSRDADTPGDQLVTIIGKNFGPGTIGEDIPDYINVSYRVEIDPPSNNGTIKLWPETDGVIQFTPHSCTWRVPHLEIDCLTGEGAGNNLQWTLIVNGQTSRDPFTYYATPEIYNVTKDNDVTIPVDSADTAGGERVVLTGVNFGPPSDQVPGEDGPGPLVQRVTFGPLVAPDQFIIDPKDIYVRSHNQIRVFLPPGIGSNLHFSVQVADQISGPSLQSFSYARPVLTAIEPSNSSSYSNPNAPTSVRIYGRNLPINDPNSRVEVVIGNQRPIIVDADLVVEPLDALKNAEIPSNPPSRRQSISFDLPSGAGISRKVMLRVVSGASGQVAFSTGHVTFNYNAPEADFVSLTSVTFNSQWYDLAIEKFGFWRGVTVVTVNGRNFGYGGDLAPNSTRVEEETAAIPAGSLDDIDRSIMLSGPGISSPNATWVRHAQLKDFHVLSWDHDQIVCMTTISGATLKVRLTGDAPFWEDDDEEPSPSRVYSESAELDISEDQPIIEDVLVDAAYADGFPTRGGVRVAVKVKGSVMNGDADNYLAFVVLSRVQTFSWRTYAQILNLNTDGTARGAAGFGSMGDPIPSNQAASFVRTLCNPSDPGGSDPGTLPAELICTLWIALPEGQGKSAGLAIAKGVSWRYGPAHTLPFAPPRVFNVTVMDYSRLQSPVLPPKDRVMVETSWFMAADRVSTVLSPTSYGRINIRGENFGIFPEVSLGGNTFGSFFWDWYFGGNQWTRQRPIRTWNELEFDIPAGSGAGHYLEVIQGDQGLDQPGGLPIRFDYQRPDVYDVTPGHVPTNGSVEVTVRGRNFGPGRDIGEPQGFYITIGKDDAVGYVPCDKVTYVDHFNARCMVPEGSGAGLDLRVSVTKQTNKVRYPFRYDSPIVDDVLIITDAAIKAAGGKDPLEGWNGASLPRKVMRGMAGKGPNGTYLANVPTRGGVEIVLRGKNFGRPNKEVHCAYSSWRGYRLAGKSLKCDDMEEHGGEGEVFDVGVRVGSRAALWQLVAEQAGYPLSTVMDWAASNDVMERRYAAGLLHPDGDSWTAGTNHKVNVTDDGDIIIIPGGGIPGIFDPNTFDNGGSDDPLFWETHVYAWSHNEVRFRIPAGAGESVVSLAVRDNLPKPTSEVTVRYSEPEVMDIVEIEEEIPTAGGAKLRIEGKNFGIAPPSADKVTKIAKGGPRPLPIRDDERTDTWFMRMEFFKQCLSNGLVYSWEARTVVEPDAVLADQIFPCSYNITMHDHEAIEFYSLPGLGVNRKLLVEIVGDGLSSPVSSEPYLFNYTAPHPLYVEPSTLYVDSSRAPSALFSIFGDNVGSPELLLDSRYGWTDIDRELSVDVSGVECARARRISDNFDRAEDGVDIVECYLGRSTVGFKNLTVEAARRAGTRFSYEPHSPLIVCKRDFYGRPGEHCFDCPEGAFCLGYENGIHYYPRPNPGFYNLNESKAKICPEARVTKGRDTCIVPCEPEGACAGDNYCSPGYRSISPMYRCATCDIGYFKRAGECVLCPQCPACLILMFIILAACAGFFAYQLNKRDINVAFIQIGVDYFQVLAIFANSRVAWPPYIKELFVILSAFNLNIEITAPECLAPDVTFETKWRVIMTLPVVVGALFILVIGSTYLFNRFYLGQRRDHAVRMLDQLVAAFFVLLYVLYLFITRTTLDIFNCAPTTPPDGKLYLQAEFVECGVPGGVQMRLLPFAWLGLFGYSLGFPCLVAYLLYRHAHEMRVDQLLRAYGLGNDPSASEKVFRIRKRYGRMYYAFRPDFHFWVLLIIGRKFLIALTSLMFNRVPGFQLAMVLLCLFLSYTLQIKFQPFQSPATATEVIRDHLDKADPKRWKGSIHKGLKEDVDRIMGRTLTLRRMGAQRVFRWDSAQAALNNMGTAVLLDYNSVESILLGSAILVSLAGIMFETAPTNSYYDTQRDTIAVLVMFIIINSIIYFFTVFGLEVWTLWRQADARIAEEKGIKKGGKDDKKRRKVGRKTRSFLSFLGVGIDAGTTADTPVAGPAADIEMSAGGGGGGLDADVSLTDNPLAAAMVKEGGVSEAELETQRAALTKVFVPERVPDRAAWEAACNRARHQVMLLEQLHEELEAARERARTAEAAGISKAGTSTALGDTGGKRMALPRPASSSATAAMTNPAARGLRGFGKRKSSRRLLMSSTASPRARTPSETSE